MRGGYRITSDSLVRSRMPLCIVLWQRLQRDMPTTLAETIRIADSYALGDPTQPELMSVEHREVRPSYQNQANERYNNGYSDMEYVGNGGNNHYGMQERI